MLNCFNNYVFPFYGCNAPAGTPVSGLYVTNLPGITFKVWDKIASEDQVSWSGVWNDVQNRALNNFERDINNEFQRTYRLNRLVQNVDLGFQYNTTTLTPNTGGTSSTTQNGIIIENRDINSQLSDSSMMLMYIQSTSFYYYDPVTATSSLTISYIDADLQTTNYTTTITQATGLVQGWNKISIEQEFSSQRMFIFASGTFTQYVDLDISNFLLQGCLGSWVGGSYFFSGFGDCNGCQARINGTSVSNQQYVNFNRTQNTVGLSMEFSLRCSFGPLICGNRNLFARAWQLKLAIELMDELRYTDRLNRYTTLDAKKFDELRNLLELQYRGGTSIDANVAQYGVKFTRTEPGELKQVIFGIGNSLNEADCCLQSNYVYIQGEARF